MSTPVNHPCRGVNGALPCLRCPMRSPTGAPGTVRVAPNGMTWCPRAMSMGAQR